MSKITIIGDVHGKYDEYLKICSKNEYTVQVGDLGYNYEKLKDLDPEKHKFMSGNHENHLTCYKLPHCLGRFGSTSLNGVNFFFVSGGFSLDWRIRQRNYCSGDWPQTYFENEELSIREQGECLKLYKKTKPDILITHEPPRFIISKLFKNKKTLISLGYDPETFTTETGELLNDMVGAHKPKIIISGHMHVSRRAIINNIKIVSLAELETYTLCQ